MKNIRVNSSIKLIALEVGGRIRNNDFPPRLGKLPSVVYANALTRMFLKEESPRELSSCREAASHELFAYERFIATIHSQKCYQITNFFPILR